MLSLLFPCSTLEIFKVNKKQHSWPFSLILSIGNWLDWEKCYIPEWTNVFSCPLYLTLHISITQYDFKSLNCNIVSYNCDLYLTSWLCLNCNIVSCNLTMWLYLSIMTVSHCDIIHICDFISHNRLCFTVEALYCFSNFIYLTITT